MSPQQHAEDDATTEWAVSTPAHFHEFTDETVARIVAHEQRGVLLSRTVLRSPWAHVSPAESGGAS